MVGVKLESATVATTGSQLVFEYNIYRILKGKGGLLTMLILAWVFAFLTPEYGSCVL